MVAVRRKGREDRKGSNEVVQVHAPSLVSYTYSVRSNEWRTKLAGTAKKRGGRRRRNEGARLPALVAACGLPSSDRARAKVHRGR